MSDGQDDLTIWSLSCTYDGNLVFHIDSDWGRSNVYASKGMAKELERLLKGRSRVTLYVAVAEEYER